MKILILVLTLFFVNHHKIVGKYESVCSIYGKPSATINLKADKTFIYRLPYIEEQISGNWLMKNDTLVLTSKFFENQQSDISVRYQITERMLVKMFF